jgi:23S rRNA (guanosine2251-2'-O)-methyltransferase
VVIYGRNAVLEALRSDQVERVYLAHGVERKGVAAIVAEVRRRRIDLEELPRIELDRLLGTTRHQGVAATLPDIRFADPDVPHRRAEERGERLLLILLDRITDPRNYGAIVRSAEVLGAHGVVTEARNSAPPSAVVAKTAAGATSHLPLVQVTNLVRYLEGLKERGVWIYGADGAARTFAGQIDWDRDAALVLGSEGRGLRRLVRERCDGLIAIRQSGRIESLNASVAAGILIHTVVESRRQGGEAP